MILYITLAILVLIYTLLTGYKWGKYDEGLRWNKGWRSGKPVVSNGWIYKVTSKDPVIQ